MFRKLLSLLIALAPMLVLGSTGQVIRVQVKGAEGDTLYLASYYGNKLFYADTALADDQGKAVFEAPDGRPAGIYAVVVPGPKYFELVLNEPEVDVRTTMDDLENAGAAGPREGSVYETIREDIIEGRLPPNARLKVSELSQRFGTSTNPVG